MKKDIQQSMHKNNRVLETSFGRSEVTRTGTEVWLPYNKLHAPLRSRGRKKGKGAERKTSE